MDRKPKRLPRKSPPVFDRDKVRLINILAELCQCDPANIEWDGSGSADMVSFLSDGRRYTLKLAKESVQGFSSNVMDFRVRVITT